MKTPADSPDGEDWTEFEAAVRDPASWYLEADRLLYCAGLLNRHLNAAYQRLASPDAGFPDSDVQDDILNIAPPMHMLCGYALECLLKGLVVERRLKAGEAVLYKIAKKEFEEIVLHGPIATHNLVKLAEMAFPDSQKRDSLDLDLLKLLQDYAVWKGRYPGPKRESDLDRRSWRTDTYGRTSEFADRLRGASKAIWGPSFPDE